MHMKAMSNINISRCAILLHARTYQQLLLFYTSEVDEKSSQKINSVGGLLSDNPRHALAKGIPNSFLEVVYTTTRANTVI